MNQRPCNFCHGSQNPEISTRDHSRRIYRNTLSPYSFDHLDNREPRPGPSGRYRRGRCEDEDLVSRWLQQWVFELRPGPVDSSKSQLSATDQKAPLPCIGPTDIEHGVGHMSAHSPDLAQALAPCVLVVRARNYENYPAPVISGRCVPPI